MRHCLSLPPSDAAAVPCVPVPSAQCSGPRALAASTTPDARRGRWYPPCVLCIDPPRSSRRIDASLRRCVNVWRGASASTADPRRDWGFTPRTLWQIQHFSRLRACNVRVASGRAGSSARARPSRGTETGTDGDRRQGRRCRRRWVLVVGARGRVKRGNTRAQTPSHLPGGRASDLTFLTPRCFHEDEICRTRHERRTELPPRSFHPSIRQIFERRCFARMPAGSRIPFVSEGVVDPTACASTMPSAGPWPLRLAGTTDVRGSGTVRRTLGYLYQRQLQNIGGRVRMCPSTGSAWRPC